MFSFGKTTSTIIGHAFKTWDHNENKISAVNVEENLHQYNNSFHGTLSAVHQKREKALV